MKVKQAKVGQALKGMSSNILDDLEYDMTFEDSVLTVRPRNPSKLKIGEYFMILAPNIAYLIPKEEKEAKKAK